jgi:iron complex transport system ATP-binding protein
VVSAGPADDVLTDDALSETFGLSLSLSRSDGRFSARRAA